MAITPDTFRPLLRRQLDHEWSTLRVDRHALVSAAGWRIVDVELRDLDQLLVAVGHGARGTDPDGERRLRRLVDVAVDDTLAGRIVLQRLMPGLLALARRRWRTGESDPFGELVGAAWIAVRTFNPRRRPACLAAALIDEIDERTYRRHWRRASRSEIPTCTGDFDGIVADTVCHPVEEIAALLRLARAARLPTDDIDLVRQLLAGSTHEVAKSLDVTPRTVRNRRDRVTARLRDLALAA